MVKLNTTILDKCDNKLHTMELTLLVKPRKAPETQDLQGGLINYYEGVWGFLIGIYSA